MRIMPLDQVLRRDNESLDYDVILASAPKSGTNWMRALAFSIINRARHSLKNSPLNPSSPHDVFPCIEFDFVKPQNPGVR